MLKEQREELKSLTEIYMVASAYKAGIPIVEIKTDNEANFTARSYIRFAQPTNETKESFGRRKEQLSKQWLNIANIKYCRSRPKDQGEHGLLGVFGNHSINMQFIFKPQQKGLRQNLENAILELTTTPKPTEQSAEAAATTVAPQ